MKRLLRFTPLTIAILLAAAGGLRAQEPEPPAAEDARPAVLTGIEVRGNERQSTSVIIAESGLLIGDTIDYRDIQNAIRRLWNTRQYRDVEVYARATGAEQGGPVVVTIDVEEQPFIAQIDIRGLENVSETTVRDTVELRPGGPLDPVRVADAQAMIRSLLAERGIGVQSVEWSVEPIANRPGENRLIIDVEEGSRVAIAEIEFLGNELFSDERLRDEMETQTEGFFWFQEGTYDEDLLRADLREALPRFYASQGHIDFGVLGDSLVVDPATGKARVIITIDEGPQYRLASFDIVGNSRFPTSELTRFFDQERGGLLSGFGFSRGDSLSPAIGNPVFDRTAFQEATQRVQQLYSNQGYLYARVEPVIQRTTLADGAPAVEVTWRIVEGQPAYVNRVAIIGNTYTHEDVIRERIFVMPGDVYSEELLIQSYQSIMGLGFFESPLPLPQIEPTETGDVDITFEVAEKQVGSINFGTAIGGGTGGIAGFLGYDHPNLFGQAKAGHLRWEFGRYSNNFEASYTDPSVMDTRLSGSLSVFSARDRFNPFRSEGQRRRTGAALRFGLPLPTDPRFSRLIIGYSLSRTTYEEDPNVDSSIFSLPPGVQSTITLGVSRNTLNHPVFPTQGTRQIVEADLNGGPLGGDGDFQKYVAETNWFVPLGQIGGQQPGTRPIRFTLGLAAEMGGVVGDASRFPFERFWMGGVQFGRSLRGYDEASITPDGHRSGSGTTFEAFGDAYLRLSAETAARINDNISVSLFYDAGNVWRDVNNINPTRLFRGAGVGVSLVTPFGPIGLDYAYGFDKEVPGWLLHFKFGPGF